jgi:hypothetical protein
VQQPPQLAQIAEKKILIPVLFTILALSIIALAAELLPEVKAKIIVIPTLLIVIGFTTIVIWKNGRRSFW